MGAFNNFENFIQTNNYEIENVKRKSFDILFDNKQIKINNYFNSINYFKGIFFKKKLLI